MKKVKVVLIVFLLIIVLYNVSIKIISENDKLSVKSIISIYENDKSIDNLVNLCSVLSYKTDYEAKLEYFDIFINEGYAQKIASNEYSNSTFHQNYFINGYKFEYCLALLHMDKFEEFDAYYSNCVTNLSEQNLFYNILFYELTHHQWTEQQLLHLNKTINKDKNKEFFNEDLLFENNCIQAKICEKNNDNSQKKTFNQHMLNYINDCNQSGDGSKPLKK